MFEDGEVIDTYGDPEIDGTGTSWEYMNSWAYKRNGKLKEQFGLSDLTTFAFNPNDGQIR